MAYGHLQLKPNEFFELTPREFTLMYNGWKQREERKGRYIQWLISPHVGKKTPKLNAIVGFATGDGNTDSTPKYVARAEQDRVLAELSEELL